MGVVTQLADPMPEWGIDLFQLHLEFVKRARTLLPNHIDRCTIHVVQATLLLTLIGMNYHAQLNFYMYIGLAVNMCQEMGMHRNLSKHRMKITITENTHDIYRRTWFCAYILERQSCLLTGRPLSIRDGEWDTSLPDWKMVSQGTSDALVDFKGFVNQIEMAKIIGGIAEIGASISKYVYIQYYFRETVFIS